MKNKHQPQLKKKKRKKGGYERQNERRSRTSGKKVLYLEKGIYGASGKCEGGGKERKVGAEKVNCMLPEKKGGGGGDTSKRIIEGDTKIKGRGKRTGMGTEDQKKKENGDTVGLENNGKFSQKQGEKAGNGGKKLGVFHNKTKVGERQSIRTNPKKSCRQI